MTMSLSRLSAATVLLTAGLLLAASFFEGGVAKASFRADLQHSRELTRILQARALLTSSSECGFAIWRTSGSLNNTMSEQYRIPCICSKLNFSFLSFSYKVREGSFQCEEGKGTGLAICGVGYPLDCGDLATCLCCVFRQGRLARKSVENIWGLPAGFMADGVEAVCM